MDLIYDLLGAAIGTWLVFNIFCIILIKLLNFKGKELRYLAFIGSAIFILVVSYFTLGMTKGFLLYLPVLFLWLLFELISLDRKKNKIDESKTM